MLRKWVISVIHSSSFSSGTVARRVDHRTWHRLVLLTRGGSGSQLRRVGLRAGVGSENQTLVAGASIGPGDL